MLTVGAILVEWNHSGRARRRPELYPNLLPSAKRSRRCPNGRCRKRELRAVDPQRRDDGYRPLGRTGLSVSALSFGCMRLADDPPLNEKLISRAIELASTTSRPRAFTSVAPVSTARRRESRARPPASSSPARAASARTPPPTLSAKRSSCSSTSSAFRISSSTRSAGSSGRISRTCSSAAACSTPCAGAGGGPGPLHRVHRPRPA